ncbi:MAG: polysaccharide pyruvyl transferase family protein [Kiritimatiellae bacterium]|nr:polysaccharide pyruvyl transferase family protein [Kiritimatiellia bacterium]
MKLLLGGIPLGCDNIGDEAILAGVVAMLKESIPGVRITVATRDLATAARLGVETIPPHGFAGFGMRGFAESAAGHDAYIWCGATGLSDYPHVALDLLEIAQSRGVATFIWGVGMDEELNPAFFRLHGRRRLLATVFGLRSFFERRLEKRLARRIASVLPKCRGVWLRDPESAARLARTGFGRAKVAADSAILLEPPPARDLGCKVLGLCISAQRRVADLDGVKSMIAAVRASGARVAGIPMNPKTDRPLLESLGVESISGDTPESVMEAAGGCAAVLSSRLHLLILAANARTPPLGIARGSKLANWLANFGREVEGDVSSCDWTAVTGRVLAALADRGDWDSSRDAAYAALRGRLEAARRELVAELEAIDAK